MAFIGLVVTFHAVINRAFFARISILSVSGEAFSAFIVGCAKSASVHSCFAGITVIDFAISLIFIIFFFAFGTGEVVFVNGASGASDTLFDLAILAFLFIGGAVPVEFGVTGITSHIVVFDGLDYLAAVVVGDAHKWVGGFVTFGSYDSNQVLLTGVGSNGGIASFSFSDGFTALNKNN